MSMMGKHSMMIILDRVSKAPGECDDDVEDESSTIRGTPWRVDSIETSGKVCDAVTKRGLACDKTMAV